jgi:mRNA interferase HigB
MFNIITRRALNQYADRYPEAAVALQKWYHEFRRMNFANANELKAVYQNASIVADSRVIFNVMGNQYRLIVRVNYRFKAVQIKWFGTHREYDRINAATVQP